jgi:hypothetical protein
MQFLLLRHVAASKALLRAALTWAQWTSRQPKKHWL